MSRKGIIVGVFAVFFLFCAFFSFFVFFFYPKKISENIKISYYPPSQEKKSQYGEVLFFSEYPIIRRHFLSNVDFSPKIDGNFYFQDDIKYFFGKKAFKKIKFVPKELELGRYYKIFFFDKEFVFSVPFPQVKSLSFDKEKKRIEIIFFEPIDEKYFFKKFKIEPSLKGDYIFSNSGKKIIFIPKKIKEDVNYRGEFLDKKISFKVESIKVKSFYFDQNKKEVVILTSKPITKKIIKEEFKIYPNLRGDFIFYESEKKVVFRPKSLKPDKKYRAKFLQKEIDFEYLSTRIKNLYFDQKNQEVVIFFTKPIEESKFFENFKISPEVNGKFNFGDKKDWVIFKPTKLKIGQLYTVNILGAKLSFKIYYFSSSAVYEKGKYIDINLSSQTMKLYQEGKVIAVYVISSGRPGMETPAGNFKVLSKSRLLWSSKYALYMPYSLQFYDGYFIHELPYWPGGYREGQWHLGIPVSHGCVRLGIGPAEKVFNFANVGTKIVIHY